jgi:hypothetical protein
MVTVMQDDFSFHGKTIMWLRFSKNSGNGKSEISPGKRLVRVERQGLKIGSVMCLDTPKIIEFTCFGMSQVRIGIFKPMFSGHV